MALYPLGSWLRSKLPPRWEQALVRRWHKRLIKGYIRRGRIPWSQGYEVYKQHLVRGAWSSSDLMCRFREGRELPLGYGVGVEERCVEYPWVLSHLSAEHQRILDAGSALNHRYVLEAPALSGRELTIVTLAPEPNCFAQRGISYVFHDLRDLPFREANFDAVVCVSTLEHVGFDNSIFTHDASHAEHQPDDFAMVMQELARVLRPGGMLLLTVPFGRAGRFTSFQQFDSDLLERAVTSFGPSQEVEYTFYRYSAGGWQIASAEDCADCVYVQWGMLPRTERPEIFPVQADGAAAARAVACVRIIKA